MLGAIVGDTVDMKKLDENFEEAGIVGPQVGKSKNREVLVTTFDELDNIIKRYDCSKKS